MYTAQHEASKLPPLRSRLVMPRVPPSWSHGRASVDDTRASFVLNAAYDTRALRRALDALRDDADANASVRACQRSSRRTDDSGDTHNATTARVLSTSSSSCAAQAAARTCASMVSDDDNSNRSGDLINAYTCHRGSVARTLDDVGDEVLLRCAAYGDVATLLTLSRTSARLRRVLLSADAQPLWAAVLPRRCASLGHNDEPTTRTTTSTTTTTATTTRDADARAEVLRALAQRRAARDAEVQYWEQACATLEQRMAARLASDKARHKEQQRMAAAAAATSQSVTVPRRRCSGDDDDAQNNNNNGISSTHGCGCVVSNAAAPRAAFSSALSVCIRKMHSAKQQVQQQQQQQVERQQRQPLQQDMCTRPHAYATPMHALRRHDDQVDTMRGPCMRQHAHDARVDSALSDERSGLTWTCDGAARRSNDINDNDDDKQQQSDSTTTTATIQTDVSILPLTYTEVVAFEQRMVRLVLHGGSGSSHRGNTIRTRHKATHERTRQLPAVLRRSIVDLATLHLLCTTHGHCRHGNNSSDDDDVDESNGDDKNNNNNCDLCDLRSVYAMRDVRARYAALCRACPLDDDYYDMRDALAGAASSLTPAHTLARMMRKATAVQRIQAMSDDTALDMLMK